MASRIHKLDEGVVNKIAAGEVVQRPSSALKELLENSIDAKATNITITAKEGGIKLLQIQDNGHGIEQQDLPLVCERFTTSKLTNFEDLQAIETFGFRGEALSSISMVSTVTITTMTANSVCAYKAVYRDGKMVSNKPGQSPDPKPCAGVPGTQILVEDVFYNMPTRKNAIGRPAEEYRRILDIVGKYAIHYVEQGVSMICKKVRESHGEVNVDLSVSRCSALEAIGIVFGQTISRELIHFRTDVSDHLRNREHTTKSASQNSLEDTTDFFAEGYVSNPNYGSKKANYVFFINHRLVECPILKKCLEDLYEEFLAKGCKPFVYLSLTIPGHTVDVNIHPTKREVHFLNEEAICDAISDAIRSRLESSNNSRTFAARSIVMETEKTASLENQSTFDNFPDGLENKKESASIPQLKPKTVDPKRLIRTDANLPQGSLEAFIVHSQEGEIATSSTHSETEKRRREFETETNSEEKSKSFKSATDAAFSLNRLKKRKSFRPLRLASIHNLKNSIEQNQHQGLSKLFKDHVFVGVANSRFALIQYETRLYLVDLPTVLPELFYQQALNRFQNFRKLRMSQSASLARLARLALSGAENDNEKESKQDIDAEERIDTESMVEYIQSLLIGRRDMLNDYFKIEINDAGDLCAMPEIIPGHIPRWEFLPEFITRVALEVDWTHEQECLDGVCRHLSYFYSKLVRFTPPPTVSESLKLNSKQFRADSQSRVSNKLHCNLVDENSVDALEVDDLEDRLAVKQNQKGSQHDSKSAETEECTSMITTHELFDESMVLSVNDTIESVNVSSKQSTDSNGVNLEMLDDCSQQTRETDKDNHVIDPSVVPGTLQHMCRHILFPAFRVGFYSPREFVQFRAVMEIARLEKLYRIFERC